MNKILESAIAKVKKAIEDVAQEQTVLTSEIDGLSALRHLHKTFSYRKAFSEIRQGASFEEKFKSIFGNSISEIAKREKEVYSRLNELKIINNDLQIALTELELQISSK